MEIFYTPKTFHIGVSLLIISAVLLSLDSLENKNPETLNYLIDTCSHITNVRRILAMRNDLTPDMLVRLLNKEQLVKYENNKHFTFQLSLG